MYKSYVDPGIFHLSTPVASPRWDVEANDAEPGDSFGSLSTLSSQPIQPLENKKPWKPCFVMEVWFKYFFLFKTGDFLVQHVFFFSEKYELKWGNINRGVGIEALKFFNFAHDMLSFFNEKDLQRSQTNRVLIVCMAQTRTRQTSLQVILELQRSNVCVEIVLDTVFHPGYWSNTWGLCNPVISWQGL